MSHRMKSYKDNKKSLLYWVRVGTAVAGMGFGTTMAVSEFNDPSHDVDWGNVATGATIALAGGTLLRKGDFEPSKDDPTMMTYEEASKHKQIEEAYQAQQGPNKFTRAHFEKEMFPKKNTFRDPSKNKM